MDKVIDHVVHVCELAGNTDHVGIGSDLDGAFGAEQSPYDLRSISDLSLFGERFLQRGFRQVDVEKLLHGNWIRFLRHAWSK